ncbi:MAG: ABC transporter permease subunit [Treponema sp.]|nr:ABC transporter permease subunit [Treponema sp.]
MSASIKRRKPWTADDTQFSLLALPTTVWYLLFSYLPMFGIIIAFIDFRISGGFIRSIFTSQWVGFDNFRFLFSNRDIWLIIRNTLGYNAVFIVVGTVLAITLALIVNELYSKRMAKIYHTIMFFPFFLSWVVVSAIVWGFLSPDMGVVNRLLVDMGLPARHFYSEPSFWPGFLLFMSQWKNVGHGMVIYLATIASIDKTVYEAALIDGATKWQQIWFITLPMMKTIIVLMFILSAGRIFYSDFGMFFQVPRDSAALYEVVTTLDVFVFLQLRMATTGMAAAAAMAQAVTACVMTLFVNWIVKRVDAESAMI